MILVALQTALLIVAGFALFRLWRLVVPSERWLRLTVAAGFLSRAVMGQVLFWISWAHLPIARSLQFGNGLWVFGQDGRDYMALARVASAKGIGAIVLFSRAELSPSFIQVLAIALKLFGGIVSVGLLLNLFFYLGMVALLAAWARKEPAARTESALVVAGVSLAPGFVLWSLQPLKDTLFQFLLIAFVALCAYWQRTWLARGRWRARITAGVLLAIVLFTIAGIRWYVAFALLIAASFFSFLVVFQSAERKSIAAAAAAVMILLLSRAFVMSAEPNLPAPLLAVLNLSFSAVRTTPGALLAGVESARASFDRTPATTMIQAGNRRNAGRASSAPPAARPATANAAAALAALNATIGAWNQKDIGRYIDGYWRSPDLELVSGTSVTRGWQAFADSYRKLDPAKLWKIEVTALRVDEMAAGETLVRAEWRPVGIAGSASGTFIMHMRYFPSAGWKIVRQEVVIHPPPNVAVPVRPPSSRTARFFAGLAAIVLPRSIGEWLGFFHIGGGRGFLWLTEIDTLIFDVALVCAVLALALRRPFLRWSALTWLVLAITLLLTVPLAYTISNFGTLFRLREMVYLGLLLTPLALVTWSSDVSSARVRRADETSAPL